MKLDEIRQKIDQIDDEIAQLFQRRMALAEEVAREKQRSGAPVLHKGREEAICARLEEQVLPEYQAALRQLYETIFHISRAHQARLLEKGGRNA